MGGHDLVALKTDCEGFPGDVEPVYEALPSPDTTLTNELNRLDQQYLIDDLPQDQKL